ncbi:MAG: ABC transporter permease [Spirosomataceae bacterium]
MRKLLFQTWESIRFASASLRSNVLRTVLSLLGVTVGIFSIIGVYTMVDSLEASVQKSLSSIGDKTIYVDKWPWQFSEGEYPWWKYFQRPEPKYKEYRYLKENSQEAVAVTILDWSRTTAKYQNNSLSALCQGITYDFNLITDIPLSQGRYFLPQEMESGSNVAIIGATIAETLFGEQDPINKRIKIRGQNFVVIGVQQLQGKELVQIGGVTDEKVFIPFLKHKRLFSSGNMEGTIVLQARDNELGMVELEAETRGLMRTRRGLRPAQDDDFALNRPDALAGAVSGIFSSIRTGGFFIGLFALLIGGFGIANIMFVSVKERTNIIGIQKSLGARNYVILLQFLFESVFLCLFGGLFGILLVYLASFIEIGSFDIVLTTSNILTGLMIASFIGVISGIVPALQAARLDPVIAIRAK